ncbi:MAG: glycine cleavage system protein H [Desulfobacteraceae bacterium]|nr:glycine cleavage system protein H [Desulfobacteraceae bacterium]
MKRSINQVWTITRDKAGGDYPPCLWMAAGAVKKKSCNNFYSCTTCRYDAAMGKKAATGEQVSWQDAMRRKGGMERVCRHSLTRRIEKRVCPYDYHCVNCDFDQLFEDVMTPGLSTAAPGMSLVKGVEVPGGYYFHHGHTWARIESGGRVRVGIDDFILALFGAPDRFELPLMGTKLRFRSLGWAMESHGHIAKFLSPVDGVIVDVNNDRGGPDPYGEGWLFSVHCPDLKRAVKSLMDNAKSLDWMKAEAARLEGMIEAAAGPEAVEAGDLVRDLFGAFPGLGWENLTRTFLGT